MATSDVVVVADEDAALRRLLARRLEAEGFDVRQIDSVCRIDEFTAGADLVVSEVYDQGASLPRLREHSDVLFVAVLPRDTDMLEALDVVDAGADDFVIKPFSPRLLVTRIRALLRRRAPQVDGTPRRLEFDGLVIDQSRREVLVHGQPAELAAREFDLLAFLASSPLQVFSRMQIMQHVWAVDEAIGVSTVTEHVRRIRLKVEADPRKPRWITTVWSVGYRFNP
jgi:DNA-binding response OmpR family regulator